MAIIASLKKAKQNFQTSAVYELSSGVIESVKEAALPEVTIDQIASELALRLNPALGLVAPAFLQNKHQFKRGVEKLFRLGDITEEQLQEIQDFRSDVSQKLDDLEEAVESQPKEVATTLTGVIEKQNKAHTSFLKAITSPLKTTKEIITGSDQAELGENILGLSSQISDLKKSLTDELTKIRSEVQIMASSMEGFSWHSLEGSIRGLETTINTKLLKHPFFRAGLRIFNIFRALQQGITDPARLKHSFRRFIGGIMGSPPPSPLQQIAYYSALGAEASVAIAREIVEKQKLTRIEERIEDWEQARQKEEEFFQNIESYIVGKASELQEVYKQRVEHKEETEETKTPKETLSTISSAVEEAKEKITEVGKHATETVTNVAKEVTEQTKKVFETGKESISSKAKDVQEDIDKSSNIIKDSLTNLKTVIKEKVSKFEDEVQQIGEKHLEPVTSKIRESAIYQKTKATKEKIGNVFEEGVAKVAGEEKAKKVRQFTGSVFEGSLLAIPGIAAVKDIIEGNYKEAPKDFIISVVPGAATVVLAGSLVKGMYSSLKEKTEKDKETLQETLQQSVNEASQEAEKVKEGATSFLSTISSTIGRVRDILLRKKSEVEEQLESETKNVEDFKRSLADSVKNLIDNTAQTIRGTAETVKTTYQQQKKKLEEQAESVEEESKEIGKQGILETAYTSFKEKSQLSEEQIQYLKTAKNIVKKWGAYTGLPGAFMGVLMGSPGMFMKSLLVMTPLGPIILTADVAAAVTKGAFRVHKFAKEKEVIGRKKEATEAPGTISQLRREFQHSKEFRSQRETMFKAKNILGDVLSYIPGIGLLGNIVLGNISKVPRSLLTTMAPGFGQISLGLWDLFKYSSGFRRHVRKIEGRETIFDKYRDKIAGVRESYRHWKSETPAFYKTEEALSRLVSYIPGIGLGLNLLTGHLGGNLLRSVISTILPGAPLVYDVTKGTFKIGKKLFTSVKTGEAKEKLHNIRETATSKPISETVSKIAESAKEKAAGTSKHIKSTFRSIKDVGLNLGLLGLMTAGHVGVSIGKLIWGGIKGFWSRSKTWPEFVAEKLRDIHNVEKEHFKLFKKEVKKQEKEKKPGIFTGIMGKVKGVASKFLSTGAGILGTGLKTVAGVGASLVSSLLSVVATVIPAVVAFLTANPELLIPLVITIVGAIAAHKFKKVFSKSSATQDMWMGTEDLSGAWVESKAKKVSKKKKETPTTVFDTSSTEKAKKEVVNKRHFTTVFDTEERNLEPLKKKIEKQIQQKEPKQIMTEKELRKKIKYKEEISWQGKEVPLDEMFGKVTLTPEEINKRILQHFQIEQGITLPSDISEKEKMKILLDNISKLKPIDEQAKELLKRSSKVKFGYTTPEGKIVSFRSPEVPREEYETFEQMYIRQNRLLVEQLLKEKQAQANPEEKKSQEAMSFLFERDKQNQQLLESTNKVAQAVEQNAKVLEESSNKTANIISQGFTTINNTALSSNAQISEGDRLEEQYKKMRETLTGGEKYVF